VPLLVGSTTVSVMPAASAVDRVILWPSAESVTLYERHGFTTRGDVMEWTSPRA